MKLDLTHLTPMERMFVTGAIKRHATEPLLDKPHIHIDIIVGWLCCAAVTWGGFYLAYHIIRWALRWL